MGDRRSFWAWCMESEEPTDADRAALAAQLSERYGTAITARPVPRAEDAQLRAPRISVPDRMSAWCDDSTYERAFHAYGASFTDRTRAFNLDFPNPPDVVAHPSDEQRARDHARVVRQPTATSPSPTAVVRRSCGA